MNPRFKVLIISILLLFLGSGYFYYIVRNFLDNRAEKQELQQIEEEAQKIKEEQIKNEVSLQKNEEIEENTITPAEKIQELRDKKGKYAYFKIETIGNFYFEEDNDNLGLYFKDKKIGTFTKVNKSDLGISNIIGNTSYVLINVGKENFLYNLITKTIKSIDLDLEIEYIKTGINNFEFLFKTPVGVFIYTLGGDALEYFVFFEDFVYYNNGYLGVIRFDEDTKLRNLGFDEEEQNLIVYYNPNTKEKRIIHKTDLSLKKIYYLGEKIFFEDQEGEEYELTNLDLN